MEHERPLTAREAESMARQYEAGGTGSQSGGWSDANRGWSSGALARDRYPLLTAMSTALRIIGWLMVVGAGVLFVVQVIPWIDCISGRGRPQQPGGWGAVSCGVAVLILAPTVVSLVSGFFMVAFGEVIGVFRGIEGNTHQLLSRIDQAGLRDKLMDAGGQST